MTDRKLFLRRLISAIFPGRAMASSIHLCEAYLISVCIVYGTILLFAPDTWFVSVIVEKNWNIFGRFLCVPLYMKASLGICGIGLNNWQLRLLEALLGSAIWCWLSAQYIRMEMITPTGFSFTLIAIYMSICIVISALLARHNPSG